LVKQGKEKENMGVIIVAERKVTDAEVEVETQLELMEEAELMLDRSLTIQALEKRFEPLYNMLHVGNLRCEMVLAEVMVALVLACDANLTEKLRLIFKW
jgi:hypothetical protein